jgi:four helix bundle protein
MSERESPARSEKTTESEPVVVARMYDLVKRLVERINGFPRSQRFVLGDRLETSGLDVLSLLVEAAYTRDKRDLLQRANLELQKLRYLTRLAKDLRLLSGSQYEHAARLTNDVGMQVGGWLKQQRA